MLKEIIGGLVKPVAEVFTAREKRKQAKQEGLNQIYKAQVDGENSLNLTDAQWEAVAAEGNAASWKDEYVTVTMTAWIWMALVGAVASAYGKPEILQGVKTFVEFCTSNDVQIGWLTGMVVSAAVGLKVWRSR